MNLEILSDDRHRGIKVRFVPPVPAPNHPFPFPDGFEVLAVAYNPGDPAEKLRGKVAVVADFPENSREAFWLQEWSRDYRREEDSRLLYRVRETEIHRDDRHKILKLPTLKRA